MNLLRNIECISLDFLHPTNMAETEYCETLRYVLDFNILRKEFFFSFEETIFKQTAISFLYNWTTVVLKRPRTFQRSEE
jgi:hypothetical protein